MYSTAIDWGFEKLYDLQNVRLCKPIATTQWVRYSLNIWDAFVWHIDWEMDFTFVVSSTTKRFVLIILFAGLIQVVESNYKEISMSKIVIVVCQKKSLKANSMVRWKKEIVNAIVLYSM